MPDQFLLFDEPYPIKRKIPFRISMDFHDDHFPPASVFDLKESAVWVRDYWNQKNLRKRKAAAKAADAGVNRAAANKFFTGGFPGGD